VTDKKGGFELLSIFYAAEKFLEINCRNISAHMNRQNISYKHFAASQLLTLFTSVFREGQQHLVLDQVFEIALEKGWSGFFLVFVAVLASMEEFVLQASMEELIRVWDCIFKSNFIHTLEGDITFDEIHERVDKKKTEKIDLVRVKRTLSNLKEAVSRLKGTQVTVEVVTEEFYAIHQKIKDILVREGINIKNIIKDV